MTDHRRSPSSSDLIVRDVVRGLYEGRYVAGQRLAEPDLMRSYGVARSTVREAIKRLVAEGVLEFAPVPGRANPSILPAAGGQCPARSRTDDRAGGPAGSGADR